ncbi:hypothetical protein L218DRAFT_866351 [Marasmius fiardii PR-910]|nr:hypothetical protein L218DRAFT_866351 [Marasmius fiardii PR-910]
MSENWRQRGSKHYNNSRGRSQRGSGRGSSPTTRSIPSSTRTPSSLGNLDGRRMENIASVSRSSGLEKDGDALKDFKTQGEYREFIQGKIDDFWNQFPEGKPTNTFGNQRRSELQENILILFRKLREGLVSSQRYDRFALEVYETSLYLSVIFRNIKQSSSIIPHLLPELYEKTRKPHPNITLTILISLLHELLIAYPSNGNYQQTLKTALRLGYFRRSSDAYLWINSLSSSLRTHNYSKFEELTRYETFSPFMKNTEDPSDKSSSSWLKEKAMVSMVDQLRAKCRDKTWSILRSAYRELACHEESGTRGWLIRSLALQSAATSEGKRSEAVLDDWLEEKSSLGHVQRKEGVQHRWLLARVR